MAEKFQLQIVTPERVVFEGEVEEVYAPGWEGEFGVLKGHEPYIFLLKIGEMRIRQNRQWIYAAISGGLCEVDYDSMQVLAETCELSYEIDVERAQRARARAEEKLKQLDPIKDEKEFIEAQTALQRALIRLQVASKGH